MSLILGSCSDDMTTNTSKTTGSLIIKTRLKGQTQFLDGAVIYLALTYEDMLNDRHFDEATTQNGKADFGELNPGNYFFEGVYVEGSEASFGDDFVQIIAGQDYELILDLE